MRELAAMFGAMPFCDLLARAQAPAPADPVLGPVNVMDFAAQAKARLDPLAWDYLDGGSEDEAALRDNRAAFNRIIIRPRALVDVHKIDLSAGPSRDQARLPDSPRSGGRQELLLPRG